MNKATLESLVLFWCYLMDSLNICGRLSNTLDEVEGPCRALRQLKKPFPRQRRGRWGGTQRKRTASPWTRQINDFYLATLKSYCLRPRCFHFFTCKLANICNSFFQVEIMQQKQQWRTFVFLLERVQIILSTISASYQCGGLQLFCFLRSNKGYC